MASREGAGGLCCALDEPLSFSSLTETAKNSGSCFSLSPFPTMQWECQPLW